MKRGLFALAVLLLLAVTPATLVAAPITIDDFEDGTTQGWFVPDPGHPNPPSNVATGGPGGAGDNYLLLTAIGGGGPGSRMSVLNESQWTGNFTGISGIAMDVNNFGPDTLFLRLLFVNFPEVGPPPPTDVSWTIAPIIVPAGSGWTRLLFDLSLSNLFDHPLFGTPAGALADVDELRLFHSVAPFFGGPGTGSEPVIARLGVDNIQAVSEPATLLLLGSGLAGLARMRRKRSEGIR